jgi:hypothetical protein
MALQQPAKLGSVHHILALIFLAVSDGQTPEAQKIRQGEENWQEAIQIIRISNRSKMLLHCSLSEDYVLPEKADLRDCSASPLSLQYPYFPAPG